MAHRFQVGDLKCIAFTEGERLSEWEAAKNFFFNAPEDELRVLFDSRPENQRRFSLNPLYIENFGLLIDTGNGLASEKPRRVMSQMQEIGIAPKAVQVIFITHAHPDHIGGLVDESGGLAFPNARYVMGQKEWDFWMHEAAGLPEDFLRMIRQTLSRMEGNLTRIAPEDEIVSGIRAVEAFGHTPGHLAVFIESAGEKLLHMVDTAHTLIQLSRPDWSPHFDVQKDLSPVTRRRLFKKAADENLRVYAYHFPFPAVGRIRQTENGFEWHFEG